MRPGLPALAALVALAAFLRAPAPARAAERATVSFLPSGDLAGYLEPCG